MNPLKVFKKNWKSSERKNTGHHEPTRDSLIIIILILSGLEGRRIPFTMLFTVVKIKYIKIIDIKWINSALNSQAQDLEEISPTFSLSLIFPELILTPL